MSVNVCVCSVEVFFSWNRGCAVEDDKKEKTERVGSKPATKRVGRCGEEVNDKQKTKERKRFCSKVKELKMKSSDNQDDQDLG